MAIGENENIIPINIEDEMRGAYIDYSMSVIISRALPDVRDGLKPVHRRVLYGMLDLGVTYNKPYKKSARIVGEVLGKYHPHGDSSVYDTMVRMAQDWSLRYPLVDGQGNFGSIDGDSPAAMRYTEARLKRISDEMLSDINKDTVDFQPNFDDSLNEPTVLPAKLPNLLINGASGIAVGMATNMPPHNLREVINGTIAYIDNNEITIPELMEYITAPDFPTGGIIYGYGGVKSAFETGRGRVVMRGKATIEEAKSGKTQIIVTEIPYMVNKASMIEKTAALVNEKRIEGISDIRDESDRNGYRIVFDLKKDAIPNVVLNHLYKYTQLQSTFGVNNVALVKGRPLTLNIKDMIKHYVDHRHEVIVRRTKYELAEAERRAHILKGYLIALDNIDEVISLIRSSRDPELAKSQLMEKFELSDIQAKAILEMRLQRLTGLEREKIEKEYAEIMELIDRLNEILDNEPLRMSLIKEELEAVNERYGDDRRTEIVHSAEDFEDEDMIPNKKMLITVSHQGYIKRTSLTEYKAQGRGGVGSKGAGSKEDDFTEQLFVANAHNYLLIFTEKGKLYWKKVYQVPEASKTAKGRPIQNLIEIEPDDSVRTIINVETLNDQDYIENNYLVMVSQQGIIKRTRLEAYSRPSKRGILALGIKEGDSLLDVKLASDDDNIILGTSYGQAIKFSLKDNIRPMGRTAAGVRGVRLQADDDKVIGIVCTHNDDATLMVVSETGMGKRSLISEFSMIKRGGKGVKAIGISDKTGKLISITEVEDTDDLMIITKSGITIRMNVSSIRTMGRAAQGVKLIRLNDSDEVASVTRVKQVEDDDEEISEENTGSNEGTEQQNDESENQS
ncbi:DNA gyrase subunit A [Aureibacter tunicatorum]|uniref:DNA gyrase subunit A n=1 Tax=Aureibacter tunicatorum TaxID=866807 RepID=A0AAE3XMQ8_9BACT|nr:DNA gyrase subunit A [Aureibacter tunicatorum]MDR6239792.1 DNA gyrase subunit A [Aureibacter tunicatorum]BDD04267.1 DNA gyrase subunit A [Aureibacter tunicatorum]